MFSTFHGFMFLLVVLSTYLHMYMYLLTVIMVFAIIENYVI